MPAKLTLPSLYDEDQEIGHVRNPYHDGDLLRTFGLTWPGDILKLIENDPKLRTTSGARLTRA